jgi:hypothetical protein
MVTRQITQDSPESRDDSVRITAQVRRQILREHYTERLAAQQAVAQSERLDRKAQGFPGEPLYTVADLRVSNAVAVLQDISSTLKSFGDDNRDFQAVQR